MSHDRPLPMITIRQIPKAEASLLPQLCALLRDAVDNGASIGFLSPLSQQGAAHSWESVFASLGEGLALWVAEADGNVVGAVQLAPSEKENARHRAEIQKLFVQSEWRGQGISSQLMAAAETFAHSAGRTLLVLDTQAGSAAESVYQHLGWQRAGEVPNYAASPDGKLHTTVYYFKALAP